MGSTKNGGFDRDMAIFIGKQKGWDFGVLSFETNSHRFLQHCETSLVFKDEKTFSAMIGCGMVRKASNLLAFMDVQPTIN